MDTNPGSFSLSEGVTCIPGPIRLVSSLLNQKECETLSSGKTWPAGSPQVSPISPFPSSPAANPPENSSQTLNAHANFQALPKLLCSLPVQTHWALTSELPARRTLRSPSLEQTPSVASHSGGVGGARPLLVVKVLGLDSQTASPAVVRVPQVSSSPALLNYSAPDSVLSISPHLVYLPPAYRSSFSGAAPRPACISCIPGA